MNIDQPESGIETTRKRGRVFQGGSRKRWLTVGNDNFKRGGNLDRSLWLPGRCLVLHNEQATARGIRKLLRTR